MTIQRISPEEYFKSSQATENLIEVPVAVTSPSYETCTTIDKNLLMVGLIVLGIVAVVAIVSMRK